MPQHTFFTQLANHLLEALARAELHLRGIERAAQRFDDLGDAVLGLNLRHLGGNDGTTDDTVVPLLQLFSTGNG
jgi:hypothetical protein